jgi:phosphoribosylglycinamide formyltransferase-1
MPHQAAGRARAGRGAAGDLFVTPERLKLAVLVSGRGSNLKALLTAIDAGQCDAQVAGVIADRASAQALELASARGIATAVVSPKDFDDRLAWDRALSEQVATYAPGLVVLAGFMRLIGSAMLTGFQGRIINVHPALLPAFPGKDAPAQAVAARVTLSGCTVHVVDSGVDTGPILAQAAVPVLHDDDAATLHTRIQSAEHRLLPMVVHGIARGRYRLDHPPRYVGPLPAAGEHAPYVWPPIES